MTVLSFVIIHTLSLLPTTLSSFVIVPQHAARCRDTWLGTAILHLLGKGTTRNCHRRRRCRGQRQHRCRCRRRRRRRRRRHRPVSDPPSRCCCSAPRYSTSWSKGQRAIAIVAAAVGADADADANANAGIVVIVVPPAIPPPVAAVKGVDRLRCATTVPARPGIVSS